MPNPSDDIEIRAVIALAAYLSDEGSVDDYVLIYAPDAIWTAGDTTQNDLEEIKAATRARRDSGATGPGSKNRHLVSTVRVEIDGDSATSTSYFIFLSGTDGTPTIRKFGIYDDQFVRTDAGWRIGKRSNRSD